jgi:glycolate oxidase iron-sulfur subunit
VTVKEYADYLAQDARYRDKAKRISGMTRDLSEVLSAEALPGGNRGKVAFHPPCTLQHGLKIRGEIERLLLSLGVDLVPVRDAHLCCGSAGTYSLLHPELAGQLRDNKLAALTAGDPGEIVTANIGCQNHLQQGTDKPVRHWIELVDDLLSAR